MLLYTMMKISAAVTLVALALLVEKAGWRMPLAAILVGTFAFEIRSTNILHVGRRAEARLV